MPKDWTAQISHVNFRCGECRKAFEGAPDLVEDDPEQAHHPFRYFAHCPHCGAQNQPQASWERALLKAHQHSTGPKTPEGVAAVTANLEGHPTPHETLRTRFNAMKHGATARTATYFPAKAGGYAFCARCDVDRDWCSKQPACVKQTEIFMLHHAAFEQRDPRVLTSIHADMHAALMATLQMCIQEVLGLGVLIKAPKVELDREGNPVTLTYTAEDGTKKYIYNYTSNPAFKPLTELISRLGLSMSDLGMTVRANDDDEEKGMGLLKLGEKDKETLSAFGQRMLKATENARGLIEQAQRATKADPVLVEHQARGGDK
nr:hypothetical protein [uncultured Acidovorax sp.]